MFDRDYKPSQKSLLARYLCWIRVSNPQHTRVCLRFETRIRLDLEPKSFFCDGEMACKYRIIPFEVPFLDFWFPIKSQRTRSAFSDRARSIRVRMFEMFPENCPAAPPGRMHPPRGSRPGYLEPRWIRAPMGSPCFDPPDGRSG